MIRSLAFLLVAAFAWAAGIYGISLVIGASAWLDGVSLFGGVLIGIAAMWWAMDRWAA